MASAGTRARSGATRAATRRTTSGPGGPIGQAAARVRTIAEQLGDQQATATHLSALQQRRDQFDAIAKRSEDLVASARVLRSAGCGIPKVTVLAPAIQAVSEIADRVKKEPRSVRSALPKSIDAPLSSVEAVLNQTWQGLAMPSPGARALTELLDRFPQFRDARTALLDLSEKLMLSARSLPASGEQVERVRKWQAQIQDTIEALQDDGLDAEVQQFLRDSADGVRLDKLLEQPSVVEFLRDHDLLSALTVSFRSTGAQGTR